MVYYLQKIFITEQTEHNTDLVCDWTINVLNTCYSHKITDDTDTNVHYISTRLLGAP
jgi:hypothetical protein